MDSAGSTGRKTEYNGKSYDYVFDVDIEDGKPPLKLPYNLSENPYEAATKFLGDNELPISYLDNVANFITQNTQGASLGQSASSGGDAQGTEARYQPGESEKPGVKVLPQIGYLSITAAKYDAMINKILQINTNMVQSGRKDQSMNPDQEKLLKDVRTAVERSRPISSEGVDLVVRIVQNWPYTDRLPAQDLLRCMAASSTAAGYTADDDTSILGIAINSATQGAEVPSDNSTMMALRTVANIFGTPKGREVAVQQAPLTVAFLERVVGISGGAAIGQSNRNLLIALTTALVNYAVLINKDTNLDLVGKNGEKTDTPKRLISVLGKVLTEQSDSEVLFRALVALGTLAGPLKADVKASGARDWVAAAKGKSSESRVKDVANELLDLLR